jgi:hypothetical protein
MTKSAQTQRYTLIQIHTTHIHDTLYTHPHTHTQILLLGPGGNLVYHGPVASVETYFDSEFGFQRPSTMSLPDFLTEITDDDVSHQYYRLDLGQAPTCLEMVEHWRRAKLRAEYILPRYTAAKLAGKTPEKDSLRRDVHNREFGDSYFALFFRVFVVQLVATLRNPALIRSKIIGGVLLAIVLGVYVCVCMCV